MPEPIPPAEASPPEAPGAPPLLEELVEPLDAGPGAEPLSADAVVTAPQGRSFRILGLLKSEPHGHLYQARTEGASPPVWLRAAFGEKASARLRHEARVLEGLDSPMFPKALACFAQDGATFLATSPPAGGATYADLLAQPTTPLPQVLTALSQAAVALAHLHERGWVHLGLRPAALALGKPVTVLDLSYAARVGDRPAAPFYHAGYSAPELLAGEPVDARADVYAVGALLYHAVNGAPVPETGAELSTWQPPRRAAGVPQVLHRCLGERESRFGSMGELHSELLRLARRLAPRVSHALSGATTIGLEPTRTTNQDAYACLSGRLASEEGPAAWSVICLADGMGGMAAGEVASAVAVRAVLAAAAAALAGNPAVSPQQQVQLVKQWVSAANEKVCAALEARRARGGCTLLCASLVGRRLAVGHVGDCRLYLLRQGRATLLTRDHSLAMTLVQQGGGSLDEVRRHPERNKVSRSLGERAPLPDHFVDGLEQATGGATLELQAGDLLLLCCDGLWEPVLEEDMARALPPAERDLDAAAERLLGIALERGAPDNATAVILRVDETTPSRGALPHAEPHPQAAPRQPEGRDGGRPEGVRHAEADPEAGGGPGAAAPGLCPGR
jgi:protein phosphatase